MILSPKVTSDEGHLTERHLSELSLGILIKITSLLSAAILLLLHHFLKLQNMNETRNTAVS